MKPLYVKLDDKLGADLDKFCEDRNMDKSKLVRSSIKATIYAEV